MSIQLFEIHISQDILDDLQLRLARTRWPDEVQGAGWEYGTNAGYLQELVAFWQKSFDWRAQEQALNTFSHFRADIDGYGIHFIHKQGQGEHTMPIVLLHGWPSSFVQMLKIIPLLTGPASHGGNAEDAFDVIVPSLIGYGFSDRATQQGMNPARMADLLAKLMQELGYHRYALHGSDFGREVAIQLALAHPDAVIGLHTGGTNPFVDAEHLPQDLTEAEQRFLAHVQQWGKEEMAYATLHLTKPQTVAYGLNDSPVGLAAWIIEKFRKWSDSDGDVERRFSKDELLTNITLYWVTQTINSSMRLYYETLRHPGNWGQVKVPSAALMSSKDMFPTPREWAERSGRYDRWTEIDQGGHFLEWEEPDLVAADMRAFFRQLR